MLTELHWKWHFLSIKRAMRALPGLPFSTATKALVLQERKREAETEGGRVSCWVQEGSRVRCKFESLWTGFLANLWRKRGEGEMKENRKERFCRAVSLHIFCLLHGWWKLQKKVICQKERWQLGMLSKGKLKNMGDLEVWGSLLSWHGLSHGHGVWRGRGTVVPPSGPVIFASEIWTNKLRDSKGGTRGHRSVVHTAVLGYQLNSMALEISSNLNNSIILRHFRIFAQHSVLSFSYNPARLIWLVGPFGFAGRHSPLIIITCFSCSQTIHSGSAPLPAPSRGQADCPTPSLCLNLLKFWTAQVYHPALSSSAF